MRIIILCLIFLPGRMASLGQTLGGRTVFNFLNLPQSPQLTGLGGINISNQGRDPGLAFYNPALLNEEMKGKLSLVFNSFYAGIKNYHISATGYHERWKTSLTGGIVFFDYGKTPRTDAIGNITGNFRPREFVVQVSASKTYLEHFRFGLSLKYIHTDYDLLKLSGLAADIGLLYRDTARLFQASLLVRNLGGLTGSQGYAGIRDLPFDLQLGISKKLAGAPIQFSFTAHHLHQFDIRYNDTTFNNDNGIDEKGRSKNFDKLFRHIVLSTQFYIGDKIEVSAGYNHLRRQDLNLANSSNGLNGFSLGLGALFKKMEIRYARSYYQNNTAYNQLGLNLDMRSFLRGGL